MHSIRLVVSNEDIQKERAHFRSPKNFWLRPGFQSAFVGYSVLMSVVAGATTFLAIRYPHIGVFAVATAALMQLAAAIYFSHRIVGPLYRIRKHLENSENRVLKLRKSDFFQDLAESVNRNVIVEEKNPPAQATERVRARKLAG